MIITTDKIMRPRDAFDHYPTPLVTAQAALRLLSGLAPVDILDPGAGTGVWGQAARTIWPASYIDGVELNPKHPHPIAYNNWFGNNFLDWMPTNCAPYDLVMGNPPYRLAEQFVRQSLALTKPDGYVIFLLRLAFLEGQARGAGLWQEHPPMRVAVCSARPSFTGNGKTDATAYAMFIWRKGYKGNTSLTWLADAPLPVIERDIEQQSFALEAA